MSLPRRVLIANRGEIAVRIIRTLRELGIESVVVHHPSEAGGLAVRDADLAVRIEAATPVAAHLDVEAIVAACVETESDAIHPGFGFLAESARFAEAVLDAGIVFIGPGPAAIAVMGDKIESKRLAQASGMPTLPGSKGAVADADEALAVAEEIGYPVLLKASAGGGGKGMRIAHSRNQCADAFETASGEAQASFGDGRLLLERYIEQPRHIEVQVLADAHGRVVHLGERECSIQRRYQKVIEESPSPAIDAETRASMGASAVALARAVDYVSAGTVEMILDRHGEFFFLEMNTRLQVEHPVTEAVTGLDIVAEQIRIAAGEPLGYEQDAVELRGHAIECRIYAEDADSDFIPAVGRLELVRLPSSDGVRVDHGLRQGQEISAAFDPMLAKVIAHAPTRAEAIQRARAALSETALLGVVTNTAYLERVLAHPEFGAGVTFTSFLKDHAESLAPPRLDVEQEGILIAAAALATSFNDRRHMVEEPHASIGGWGR